MDSRYLLDRPLFHCYYLSVMMQFASEDRLAAVFVVGFSVGGDTSILLDSIRYQN